MDEKLIIYQRHLVEMLSAFEEFCNLHNIKFFLVGGSALGAYRHNGFIPWDDDIDVAMLRRDFEKLEYYLEQQNNQFDGMIYSPVDAQIIPDAPIGHIYDTNVAENLEDSPKIDIHPIDGVPESVIERKIQKITALIYYLGIYHLPVKNKGKFARYLSIILLKMIPESLWKMIEKKCKQYFTRYEAEQSKEICSLFGVAGYNREVMPKKWIFPLRRHSFEDKDFWVPVDKDSYLKRLYGDWRKLPKKNEQKPQHDAYKRCNIGKKKVTRNKVQ